MASAADQPAAGLRILIAEDDPVQCRTLRRALLGLGAAAIEEAADGQAALDIACGRMAQLDVVITDLDMPGMDGLEFIRRLAEARIPAALIIVSILESSVLVSAEHMAAAYGVNLLGTIPKPITAGKLSRLLRLRGRRTGPAPAPAPALALHDILTGLERGQFEPFFQPKIELATGRPVGAEALARWRHPDLGVIGAPVFIPLLEQHGGIDRLTWVILEAAARHCAAWRAQGHELTVSINLSLRSLSDPGLADELIRRIRAQGLAPSAVVLEVTESTTASEYGPVLENLSRLRMRGFGLSIDDYGIGYSSMQQLTRIAFTELKIDQSFVQRAVRSPRSRIVLESSLQMARKLGLAAVAEGVETQETLDLLRRLGCDLVQGYHVAHPMEAAAFVAWGRARRPDFTSRASSRT